MKITWTDFLDEPSCPPNPSYPMGIDLDISEGATKTCKASLPYPAKRCGFYSVECETCGQRIVATTAGRPDDPRSVKMACRGAVQ